MFEVLMDRKIRKIKRRKKRNIYDFKIELMRILALLPFILQI